jgi:molecular chaperone DnaK
VHLRHVVLREDLEGLVGPLIERTRAPCLAALEAAGITADQVDKVVLVGGVTKMPAVQRMAQSLFPASQMVATDPDKIVAIGAALLASSLDGGIPIKLQDVTPHAVSIETAEGSLVELIPAQSKVPAVVTRRVGCAVVDQGAVTARLVQGEDLVLGQFHLELGKGPAREGRVELSINLDANGTVHAQMREAATGKLAASPMNLIAGIDDRAIARLAKANKKALQDDVTEEARIDDIAAAAAAASPVVDAFEPDAPVIEVDEPIEPPPARVLRMVHVDDEGVISGVASEDEAAITERVENGEALEDALRSLLPGVVDSVRVVTHLKRSAEWRESLMQQLRTWLEVQKLKSVPTLEPTLAPPPPPPLIWR